MTTITRDFTGQTVITTFDMSPGTAADLLEALQSAWAEVISQQPGFIAGALHMNDAQTRISSYSQWRDRRDYQAMLRLPEMRERNRHIHTLCKSFEPVMYDVAAIY